MSFSDPGLNLLNQFIIRWLSVLLLTDEASAHFTSKKQKRISSLCRARQRGMFILIPRGKSAKRRHSAATEQAGTQKESDLGGVRC